VPDDPDDEDTDRRRPTAAERHHRRSYPLGVPVRPPEVPSEAAPDADFDWPAALDRLDAEVPRRAGRDPDEPAARAEISAIARQLVARLRLLTDAPQDLNRRLVALEGRLGPLERDFEPVRRLGKWAAGVALGAALAIGAFLYRRGADEQRVADEINEVRDHAARLQHQIDSFQTSKEPRP
jgi:hypothetical protein